MTSSTPEFLRRQAARMLAQAEELERLGVIKELFPNSVIMFSREIRGRSFNYAAILVDATRQVDRVPTYREMYRDAPELKWFVTQGGRGIEPMNPEAFIRWLAEGNATDIWIVDGRVSLETYASRVSCDAEPATQASEPDAKQMAADILGYETDEVG